MCSSSFRPVLALALLALISGSSADVQANDSTSDSSRAQTLTAVPAGNQEELLKWALAHSDPDELRRAAAEVTRGAESGDVEFLERQQRVQALLEAMKSEPTEAELMQEAVDILRNGSASQQQLVNALVALRYLTEPIDAANNLAGMGGLAPVVALLAKHQPAAVQAEAAFLLGSAAANNHEFQAQLLGDSPEVLAALLALLDGGSGTAASNATTGGTSAADQEVAAASVEAGVKALYCLSALLRLSSTARAAFHRAAGMQTLQLLLGSRGADVRLKRKALGLLTDLIHLDTAPVAEAGAAAAAAPVKAGQAAGLNYGAAVATALQLLDVGAADGADLDHDTAEKALLALQALLDSPADGGASAARRFAESSGAAILTQLRMSLQAAAAAEEDAEYLLELAELAGQVQAQAAAAGGSSAAAQAMGGLGAWHDSTEL